MPDRRSSLHLRRAGRGEPLVLLHGLGGELCVWAPVWDALTARHDVLAVDLPGFGRSAPLPEDAVPSPRALAVAVAGLLDELGLETVHVAGNSLGAWVALELAALGRARTVTGLCPAGLWRAPLLGEGEAADGRGHLLARRLRPLLPLALLSRRLRHRVLAPFVAHPERVPYRAAWRMVSSYARATAYAATSTAMRRDHFRAAGDVHVPVTLAFGERDRLIRPARTAIRGARSLVLPDCGHIPMWDAPELVAGVVLETTSGALEDAA